MIYWVKMDMCGVLRKIAGPHSIIYLRQEGSSVWWKMKIVGMDVKFFTWRRNSRTSSKLSQTNPSNKHTQFIKFSLPTFSQRTLSFAPFLPSEEISQQRKFGHVKNTLEIKSWENNSKTSIQAAMEEKLIHQRELLRFQEPSSVWTADTEHPPRE